MRGRACQPPAVAEMRVREATRSGAIAASFAAIMPPILCPITWTGPQPNASYPPPAPNRLISANQSTCTLWCHPPHGPTPATRSSLVAEESRLAPTRVCGCVRGAQGRSGRTHQDGEDVRGHDGYGVGLEGAGAGASPDAPVVQKQRPHGRCMHLRGPPSPSPPPPRHPLLPKPHYGRGTTSNLSR